MGVTEMEPATAEAVEAPSEPDAGQADRSRLAVLRRTLTARQELHERLGHEILRLEEAEDVALTDQLRAAPTKRAYALRSPVQLLRDKRQKAEAKLPGLEREIRELASLVEEAEREALIAELEEATRVTGALREDELELWASAGQAIGSLHATWAAIGELAEERDRLAGEMVRRVGPREDLAEELRAYEHAARPTVAPMPVEFAGFLRLLVDGALDPGRIGYRDTHPDATRLDQDRVLVELIPDLRPDDRRLELSYRIDKRSS